MFSSHALQIPHARRYVYPEKPVQKRFDRTEIRGEKAFSLYREHGTLKEKSTLVDVIFDAIGQLRARMNVERGVDFFQVSIDGIRFDVELLGNFRIRETTRG